MSAAAKICMKSTLTSASRALHNARPSKEIGPLWGSGKLGGFRFLEGLQIACRPGLTRLSTAVDNSTGEINPLFQPSLRVRETDFGPSWRTGGNDEGPVNPPTPATLESCAMSVPLRDIWFGILNDIAALITPQECTTWLQPLVLSTAGGSSLRLEAPSSFHRDTVRDRFGDHLRRFAENYAGSGTTLEFVVADPQPRGAAVEEAPLG